ncbi:Hypothetical protein PBC10988_17100 [Planctomycetales bacterium 10988]|nr:Hypothetical protein PBC10988_17100 [Planctomycetales bacterium 10988]
MSGKHILMVAVILGMGAWNVEAGDKGLSFSFSYNRSYPPPTTYYAPAYPRVYQYYPEPVHVVPAPPTVIHHYPAPRPYISLDFGYDRHVHRHHYAPHYRGHGYGHRGHHHHHRH